ncbi:hypothetical protein M409DRAFT_19406 [Zasmidium cellare ATCC 36951]|uniref:Uncharacterized protein n=1 Tax=Zasmidium cellare ATCC 36951 TaxID=1080233 RepID=A0A6A6CXR3_ZASCE|nr:uncharacterized protein M409DRAFT_19406 [Zasmidium cellare ATCC 36951]KAF2170589.1 hypothetical protein M409DRAFT_19406 [Zasmidium cellare ATCC 36951]
MDNITFHKPHPLPHETVDCWLVAVKPCKYDSRFFAYALDFDDSHTKWRAECYVPSSEVGKETQKELQRGREVRMEADEQSWGRCTFKDLVGEDERRQETVRSLTVRFNKANYSGHVYVPPWAPVAKDYHRLISGEVKKSIEPKPQTTPPRRTVEFLGPIRANSQVRTEVWSQDGESVYRGGAKVLKFEVEGGRRLLTIKAPVDVGQYAILVGDVGDTNWARCGRFQEVEDPEQEASDVFKLPPWVEEE